MSSRVKVWGATKRLLSTHKLHLPLQQLAIVLDRIIANVEHTGRTVGLELGRKHSLCKPFVWQKQSA